MITGAQDFIRQWTRVHPSQIAIEHPSALRSHSYSSFNERIDLCATMLMRQGVRQGDRVAILARSCVEQFELLFACIRLGAIFTPLNWRLAGSELAEITAHCEPKVLIFDDRSRQQAEVILESTHLRILFLGDHSIHLHESLERYHSVIDSLGTITLDERVELHREREAVCTAMMLYTSGTTGRPKGVLIPHSQLFWNAINTVFACDLSPSDRTLAFLPLFHTGGLNCLATPTLYRGGRVVLMDAFDPSEALSLISSRGITSVVAVPAMYQMLLDHGLEDYDLSSLKTLLCGGAPLPDSLLDAWLQRGFAFRQGFGMTEIGPNCFSLPASRVNEKRGSIGQPVLHCEAKIVDENGDSLGLGEVGELWLGGPIISGGYFNDEEATSKSYEAGWLKTGDLARYDDEGYFYIAGRKKEMFISGGENVYPAEIENVLLAHPHISEATVIGIPDARWGEVGLAVIVLREGKAESEENLRAWCRERLAGFKTPKRYLCVEELPRNASGKVIKARVMELYHEV